MMAVSALQHAWGNLVPLLWLWDREGESALFRSEHAARWFVRMHRDQLVKAKAVIFHNGGLMVHPERFLQSWEKIGLERAARTCVNESVP